MSAEAYLNSAQEALARVAETRRGVVAQAAGLMVEAILAASRERLLATLPPLLEKIKPLQEPPPLPRTA